MRMLLVFISLLYNTTLAAQENPTCINSALFNAIIDGESRSVQVKVSYDFTSQEELVDLKRLNFPSSPIGPVRAYVNGEPQELSFQQNGKISSAQLTLRGSGSEPYRLQLSYEVPLASADQLILIIPVIYPDIPAKEASQDFFQATVQLKGYQLHEAFPSASWVTDQKVDWDIHTLRLQAVPSMIKLSLGKGGKALLSTLNLVDLAVIIILLMLLALGWKKIRQV